MPGPLRQPESIDDLLLFRLHRLLATPGARIVRLCEGQLGITWREWRVLASLQPHRQLLSSELAQATHLDRVRTSRAITSLAEKGLVARSARPGDRRRVDVSLTAAGRALYTRFFPVVVQLNNELLDGLSDTQVAQLGALLEHCQQHADGMARQDDGVRAVRTAGGRSRLRL